MKCSTFDKFIAVMKNKFDCYNKDFVIIYCKCINVKIFPLLNSSVIPLLPTRLMTYMYGKDDPNIGRMICSMLVHDELILRQTNY